MHYQIPHIKSTLENVNSRLTYIDFIAQNTDVMFAQSLGMAYIYQNNVPHCTSRFYLRKSY